MSFIIKEKAGRLDIRLPLAVMLTLLLQGAAIVVWAAQLDMRVRALEKHIEPLADATHQLARIEERLINLRKDSDYMKHKLDSLHEKVVK